jgi:Tol biopolymer transport system component
LEKNPEARFHSASDVAFALEELSGTSASGAIAAQHRAIRPKPKLLAPIGVAALAVVLLGIGWMLGGRGVKQSWPQYKPITFRLGSMLNARFTPDGSVVYSAGWDGEPRQLYIAQTDNPGARELGIKDADILSISKNGEMAMLRNAVRLHGYALYGTLAEVALGGGTPRDVLDYVQDADWAPNGTDMAVVRYVPENAHWRLEYPVGHVLLDTVNWLSHPKISADGRRVAFSDHMNPDGDDEGGVAVIGPDGKEQILAKGYSSLQGILWSPKGDEVWFTSSVSGSATTAHAVTLEGKLRTVASWPDQMYLEDIRDGVVLTEARHMRVNIRGLAPGAKEEKELGWFGWSELNDFTPDGKKILFEEEAEGGGPNYTIFLRDTDGSPPVSLGEGMGLAISPDKKWVVTQPAKGGPLSLVPTGAGEARPLTHDNVEYSTIRFLPDGKQLLALGVEPGHGVRDYLIDIATGASRAITPEGVRGVALSPDATATVVMTAAGTREIWPLNGGAPRPIPGVVPGESIGGWTADGKALYVVSQHPASGTPGVYIVSLGDGKRTFWKTSSQMGTAGVSGPGFWSIARDGKSYVYVYSRQLATAYVVTGMR